MVETGVSYFSSRTMRHFLADLDDMLAHHCSYVVHCFTETDLLYYRETMREIVGATKAAGLDVWLDPWGVAGVFSGETLSRFPLDNVETLQVLSDGRRAPASCPNHPETRRFLREWVRAAAETGGDGVIWDEPHFFVPLMRGERSKAWACRCDVCRERFCERTGRAMPDTFDAEVRAFRDASVIELIDELATEARRLGLRNDLCLFPVDFVAAGFPGLASRLARTVGEDDANANPLLQFGISDWEAAAAIPALDMLGTDPYWFALAVDREPFFSAFVEKALGLARRNGLKSQVWVQAFLVPEGREEELKEGLACAAALGADYVAAWSYGASESISRIRCARPDVVWRVIGEAFRALRGEGQVMGGGASQS